MGVGCAVCGFIGAGLRGAGDGEDLTGDVEDREDRGVEWFSLELTGRDEVY